LVMFTNLIALSGDIGLVTFNELSGINYSSSSY